MSRTFTIEKRSITVETRAKGMLAKLAHDLRIEIEPKTLEVTDEGSSVRVQATVRGDDLRVVGVLKGTTLDTGVLSSSDVADIQKKIRGEVLERPVDVSATIGLDGNAPSAARVSVELSMRGKKTTAGLSLTSDADGDVVRARGSFTFALTSLGITPPKGPLNAFRVDDEVRVSVDVSVRIG